MPARLTPVAALAVLFAADAGCASLISCWIADLCVFRTGLNACSSLYVLYFFVLTCAQTLLCLHRLRQRLRGCFEVYSASQTAPRPEWMWVERRIADSGRFLVKSAVFNAASFGIFVLGVSDEALCTKHLDDAAERCWYTVAVGYLTSSVLYVIITQLATTLTPTACLFVVEAGFRRRYPRATLETGKVPDTEAEVEASPVESSSQRTNKCSLPYVRSIVPTPSAVVLCWRLMEDVVCLFVLLCCRTAFCSCSCNSFEVYSVLMTGLLGLLATKLALFVCLCWCFKKIRRILHGSPATVSLDWFICKFVTDVRLRLKV